MRKSLVIILPILVLSSCLLLSNFTLSQLLSENIENYNNQGNRVVASGDLGFVLEKQGLINNVKYISNGAIVGECVWLQNSSNTLNRICDILGLMITNKYSTTTHYMIEGKSALIRYSIKNHVNNIQIAVTDSTIVVGSPIIFGSY